MMSRPDTSLAEVREVSFIFSFTLNMLANPFALKAARNQAFRETRLRPKRRVACCLSTATVPSAFARRRRTAAVITSKPLSGSFGVNTAKLARPERTNWALYGMGDHAVVGSVANR
jgi:hypothetical protein